MTYQQTKDHQDRFRKFLNDQGFGIDPSDDLWMEEKLTDHSFKEVLQLMDDFQDWTITEMIKELE